LPTSRHAPASVKGATLRREFLSFNSDFVMHTNETCSFTPARMARRQMGWFGFGNPRARIFQRRRSFDLTWQEIVFAKRRREVFALSNPNAAGFWPAKTKPQTSPTGDVRNGNGTRNMNYDAPNFGEFIKIIASGEIVRWTTFDPVLQTLEIILPNGDVSIVHQRQIQPITANEELAFLISRKKNKIDWSNVPVRPCVIQSDA